MYKPRNNIFHINSFLETCFYKYFKDWYINFLKMDYTYFLICHINFCWLTLLLCHGLFSWGNTAWIYHEEIVVVYQKTTLGYLNFHHPWRRQKLKMRLLNVSLNKQENKPNLLINPHDNKNVETSRSMKQWVRPFGWDYLHF